MSSCSRSVSRKCSPWGDTEKLQDIRVADDLFGFDTPGFGTGNLLFHGFLVSAGQQAVIEKRVDLAVELPDTPVFLDALVQVKITGGIARHLEKRAAMRPAQFITQRVIFRVALVKLPHVPQVGGREPVSELRHEPPGKGVDDSLAISGTAGSLLLVLHYIFPYLPVSPHEGRIDMMYHLCARFLQDMAHVMQ